MPTYVYRREDGTTFEIMQRITEPALKQCPTTGQPVKRVIGGGAGIVFKGSGFYQTDYVRKANDTPGPSTEKKPDPKPEAASSTPQKTESSTTD